MSNNYFSGISKNELPSKLTVSDIKSDTIETASLSFSGTYPILRVTGSISSYGLTTEELLCMAQKGVLLIRHSGLTSHLSLHLGADTAIRANELLTIFNLTDTATKRLIRVTPTVAVITYSISLANSTSGGLNTSNNVKISEQGGVHSHTQYLITGGAKGEAYILVSKPGTDQILFDIICQSTV
jgi:hypothetical protein